MSNKKTKLKDEKTLSKDDATIGDLSVEAVTETIVESGLLMYRRLAYISLGLMGVMLCILLVLALKPAPTQEVRGTSPNGEIHQLVILQKPNQSPSTIIDFTTKCLRNSLSFNFKNFERKDKENSYCFTSEGRSSFLTTRGSSEWFNQIINENMAAITTSNGVGVISGELDGVDGWILEIPLIMKRQALGKVPNSMRVFVRVVVLSTAQTKHASGLAIHDAAFIKQ